VDAWREAEAIDTSVLVVQAGDDRVVDGSAAKAWLETVTAPDTRFHELEGQFHELHYEDEWTATVDLIHAWLSPRVGTGQPLIPAAASLARAA
jgi:alpha-beta hydrolase superfamily lysophospholipase